MKPAPPTTGSLIHFTPLRYPGGKGKLAVVISPFMTCEEAYLLATLARIISPNAVLFLGKVPLVDEDEVFKSGFTTMADTQGEPKHGTGMSLVSRYVHEAGGKIALASIQGQETRFKVTLPALATAGDAQVA